MLIGKLQCTTNTRCWEGSPKTLQVPQDGRWIFLHFRAIERANEIDSFYLQFIADFSKIQRLSLAKHFTHPPSWLLFRPPIVLHYFLIETEKIQPVKAKSTIVNYSLQTFFWNDYDDQNRTARVTCCHLNVLNGNKQCYRLDNWTARKFSTLSCLYDLSQI